MDEEGIWAMYFVGIASMQAHPGYTKPGNIPLDTAMAAKMADHMLKEHRRRYPCPGSSAEQE